MLFIFDNISIFEEKEVNAVEYIWIIWASLALVSVIVEAATVSLVSIWLIPGEIVAALMAAIGLPIWSQILVFLVISSLLIAITRKISVRILKDINEKTNIDLLIGKNGIVIEEINNINQTGAIKVDGKEWTARAENDCMTFKKGDIVEIKSISGVKLIVSQNKKNLEDLLI